MMGSRKMADYSCERKVCLGKPCLGSAYCVWLCPKAFYSALKWADRNLLQVSLRSCEQGLQANNLGQASISPNSVLFHNYNGGFCKQKHVLWGKQTLLFRSSWSWVPPLLWGSHCSRFAYHKHIPYAGSWQNPSLSSQVSRIHKIVTKAVSPARSLPGQFVSCTVLSTHACLTVLPLGTPPPPPAISPREESTQINIPAGPPFYLSRMCILHSLTTDKTYPCITGSEVCHCAVTFYYLIQKQFIISHTLLVKATTQSAAIVSAQWFLEKWWRSCSGSQHHLCIPLSCLPGKQAWVSELTTQSSFCKSLGRCLQFLDLPTSVQLVTLAIDTSCKLVVTGNGPGFPCVLLWQWWQGWGGLIAHVCS